MNKIIPFNKPYLGNEVLNFVNKVFKSDKHSGNGIYTKRVNDLFKKNWEYLKNKWVSEEKTKWTTIKDVKKQLEELEENGCNISVLNDLKDFYKDRLADKKCFIEFD